MKPPIPHRLGPFPRNPSGNYVYGVCGREIVLYEIYIGFRPAENNINPTVPFPALA